MNEKRLDNSIMETRKGYYKDEVIAFFCCLLKFFSAVRKCSHEARMIIVKVNEKEYGSIDKTEFYISEKLTDIFFKLQEKKARNITVNGQTCQVTNLFGEVGGKKFQINNQVENEIQQLKAMKDFLSRAFIEPDLEIEIQNKLDCIINFYDDNRGDRLWYRNQIEQFLDMYYDALCYLIQKNEILEIEGVRKKIVKPILSLGIESTEQSEKKVLYAKMTSPMVLSAMKLVYERLDEFLDLKCSELEEEIYQEIFLAKIHQIFRFNVTSEESDELYYAALPAYTDDEEYDLRIPVRSIKTYDSYQGIRELRLGDKILYELKQRFQLRFERDLSHKVYEWNDPFGIVLIGEIAAKPLKEMILYVERYRTAIFEKESKKNLRTEKEISSCLKLRYTIITNKEKPSNEVIKTLFNEGGKTLYTVEWKEKLNLVTTESLQSIMEKNDLIFLLDSCQLYNTKIQPIDDLIVFKQKFLLEKYTQYFARTKFKDLVLQCKYADLYNALITYSIFGELGYLKKYAREDVIKFIKRNMTNMVEEQKTVYIYISDIDAFRALKCVQEHIVRIEKYNQKKIGIIRFADWDNTALPVHFETEKCNHHIIVFTLWQFAKHCMINKRDVLASYIFDEEDEWRLKDSYIGIDYSDWQNKIKVIYWFECEEQENERINEKMRSFIDEIVIKSLISKEKNMYNRYMNQIFMSILYGNSKSIEDLIFLNILKKHSEKVIKVTVEPSETNLVSYFDWNCKYSYKKVFWEVIEAFDLLQSDSLEQYKVLNEIRSNQQYAKAESTQNSTKDLFDKIKQACESIHYTDSGLYENCMQNINN